jgi:capsular exopolysaccharide synthesis family protein
MIAMSGKRVLVVDCDLRHPSVHLYFGLENNLGLTSVLQGTAPFEECLQQVDGERLQVLTAGPTHSPELLVSAEMAALLTTLQDRYDCILLDSPPLLNLSDGVLLAALAHAAVLVVSFDRTRQPHLQEATRILANIGIPILGVVHNRSTEAPSPNWLAKKG